MNKWINVKERLPENKREVLIYFKEDDEFNNIEVMPFYEKGTVIDHLMDFDIIDPEERVLDCIKNKNNEVIAEKSWFYILSNEVYPHNDSITHWMPLPEPPKE